MRGSRTLIRIASEIAALTPQEVRLGVPRADVVIPSDGHRHYEVWVVSKAVNRAKQGSDLGRAMFHTERRIQSDDSTFNGFSEGDLASLERQAEATIAQIKRHYIQLATEIAPKVALTLVDGATSAEEILKEALDSGINLLKEQARIALPDHVGFINFSLRFEGSIGNLTFRVAGGNLDHQRGNDMAYSAYAQAIDFPRIIRFFAAVKLQLRAMASVVPADWTP